MALFSLRKYAWNFPSNNHGQIFGIADSGVETFNGTPIKSLAREICQNSIDANLRNGEPTHIVFHSFEIAPSDIPGFDDLEDAFSKSLKYWSKQQSTKAKSFFQSALKLAKQPKITCLRISDTNTTGLLGSDEEYNSPWCNLTKSQGASDKSGSHGGSFGIGKFAPYACSIFRTVFYSTLDSEGVTAYQGVARLTSFKDKNGETTQGIGFYGADKNAPVKQQISIDPSYSRKAGESGTDIFVLGFNGGKDWKHDMVASVLDGFLYAVYTGELIVEVEDIVIRKETLPELIASHKEYFSEYADEYYQVLTADEQKSPIYTTDIGTMGKVTLRLMIQPDFHRRVAMVRRTGMKITDKGNINGLIPFAGVLYIEGEKLNEYLRTLENPQHTKWEIERAENRAEAKGVLSALTKFIKARLDELKNDDSEEALDPSVGEYLAAEQDPVQPQPENKGENINDTIQSIETKTVSRNPKSGGMSQDGTGATEVDDPNGDIIVDDIPGEGSREGNSTGGSGGGGGGSGEGGGTGDKPTEHRKSVTTISAVKSRVMCTNKNLGEYTITFVQNTSATDGIISLFMSAESQNYDASLVSVAVDGAELAVSGNKISGLTFTENVPVKLSVKIDFHDYCSMEVRAYGNKV